jgi:diacylglycerol O-acyltransferase
VDERRNPLAPEDLAILRLESPTIAGHTCKVLTVNPASGIGRLTVETLGEHLAGRLTRIPRMTARLSDDSRQPAWVPDPRFDVRNHVRHWPQARPATRAELLDAVAALMTTRLDRSRPLWSMHLLDLVDERSALVVLLHHCMVDGASAVRALSAVLWDPVAPASPPPLPAPATAPAGTPFNLRGVVRRELMPKATDTPLDRHPSPLRRVAATRASLGALKRIGKTVGGGATVNDVVLCAVAGGLRRWLEHHGGPLHGIRVQVPVSLHDAHERSDELGNHDSFMVVDVGTDEPEPATRLRAIASRTRELKTRHDAQSLDHLFQELRRVSRVAAQALASWAASPRVFAVNVSNVPGPATPVAVMGGAVRDLWALAEIADRHALRVAAISLADELSFGLCADAVAVADPETIAAGIEADLQALGA